MRVGVKTLICSPGKRGLLGGSVALNRRAQLDRFLAGTETRAFVRARYALQHEQDALDAVQEAMYKLVRRYRRRPAEQWPGLFYRILENQIKDMQRHRTVRQKVLGWLPGYATDDEDTDPMARVADAAAVDPQQAAQSSAAIMALEAALQTLPRRQQQAFLLRAMQQLSVHDTALAMGVSPGSVKTHYSRALTKLREQLGEHWS